MGRAWLSISQSRLPKKVYEVVDFTSDVFELPPSASGARTVDGARARASRGWGLRVLKKRRGGRSAAESVATPARESQLS